jgi:hypothetical protein
MTSDETAGKPPPVFAPASVVTIGSTDIQSGWAAGGHSRAFVAGAPDPHDDRIVPDLRRRSPLARG